MVKPTQQQQEQDKRENINKKLQIEFLRLNILRDLLNGNFDGIPMPPLLKNEMQTFFGRYVPAKFKQLFISIIDIIHDAHHTRDKPAVANELLFKIIVCNIFGISLGLYNYIYKNVVPVTSTLIVKFVQSTPSYTGVFAQEFFRDKAPGRDINSSISIMRDNVGLGADLITEFTRLGFTIVQKVTQPVILDAVSRTITPADYNLLDVSISEIPRVIGIENELFPGTVNIGVLGNHEIGYTANIQYNPPIILAGGAGNGVTKPKKPSKKFIDDARAAAAKGPDYTRPAAAVAGPPARPAAAVAGPPARPAAAVAGPPARPPTRINDELIFNWNPNRQSLRGYRPITCENGPVIGPVVNVPTCLPSNHTKNCVFSIALTMINTNPQLLGLFNMFNIDGPPFTFSEFIVEVNNELNIELTQLAGQDATFKPLTLQHYILSKLIGDYSYKMYYIPTNMEFVSTSDGILGLRLFMWGYNCIFVNHMGCYVFYNNMDMNAPIVNQSLPKVLNASITKKSKVNRQLEDKVRAALINKIKVAPAKTEAEVKLLAAPIKNKRRKLIPMRRPLSRRIKGLAPQRLRIGSNIFGLVGGQPPSSFEARLVEIVIQNPSFDSELLLIHDEDVEPSKISGENLKSLVLVLKTQFNLFKEQLSKFQDQEGGKFFMFLGSSNDYKKYCNAIISYLGNIIDIMSSEEFTAYFIKECTGKSYEECIKIMNSYVVMFPFIFDIDTSSWYLNYTYPFSVCLNEYILYLLDNQSKDSVNSDVIEKIIKFVGELKTSASQSTSTPLEYGKNMPFNNAVTFVILAECRKENTQSSQQFSNDYKLYNEQSKLQLTVFDDNSLPEFLKRLSSLKKSGADSDDADDDDDGVGDVDDVTEVDDDQEYFNAVDDFFQTYVVDNNILYEDFVKELVSFLIPSNSIIREGIFSFIKFILLFQNFDNVALCTYTIIKRIIEALLTKEYSGKSCASINNELNMLFYYNNLDNFYHDVPELVKKIKDTRTDEGLTSIDQLSILEQNISILTDMYSYSVDYALSNFYDQLYDHNIESEHTFETTDEYVNFQMGKFQECINKELDRYLSVDEVMDEEQPQPQFNPLGLQHGTIVPEGRVVTVETGGNNKHISNPKSKHNAKYRKKYKKFVSKYIIKKKQNKNKNKSTNSIKNKTRKNKKLIKPKAGSKSKSKSKYAKKTLKNKKRKSKSKSNRKSKHNKKANTNYYNIYKHNKTLKH